MPSVDAAELSSYSRRMLFWEDIKPGQVFATPLLNVTEQDILEFAREYDPQPYHLDKAAAEASIFGGLCASGWHTCAMMMRLLADSLNENQIACLGSSGVRSLRWFKPVFAGDTLSAAITVEAHDESSRHPEFGLIECAIDVLNQHQRSVIKLHTTMMIAHREAGTKHV